MTNTTQSAERAKCSKHGIPLDDEECGRCDGEGVLEDDDDLLHERPPHVKCWGCGGRGFHAEASCYACNEEILEEMHAQG
jgi:DnaJ-class molecular chaperone